MRSVKNVAVCLLLAVILWVGCGDFSKTGDDDYQKVLHSIKTSLSDVLNLELAKQYLEETLPKLKSMSESVWHQLMPLITQNVYPESVLNEILGKFLSSDFFGKISSRSGP